MTRLPPRPVIDWSNAEAPRATAFDDVYFSREGGLAESEAVFLAGCGLPDGWRGARHYAICELGFGSGLNVLAAWRAWRRSKMPHAQLHISTIEAFPLAREDAARALAAFPEIADLAAPLIECWPVRAYAPQRLWFADDGFSLTLHIGDAVDVLKGMGGAFDAWFLDGFAPARNPDMWSEAVYAQMARLSRPGARAASFSVAGGLRRGLEAAGFRVAKMPGFGAKRERLEARFAGEPTAQKAVSRVAVIGAGIAGAAVADALARREVETVVLDGAHELGTAASGNPIGLVMPRLDRGGALRELFLAAYLHAVRRYEALGPEVFFGSGVEQRADARSAAAHADLLADPPLPEDWLHAAPNGALWHARAGALRPVTATRALLSGASVLFETPVAALQQAEDGWTLRAPDGRAVLKADAVVLACGAGLTAFGPARFLPIELSRGQIEWGAGRADHPIAQSHYLTPFDGGVLFGATFDPVAPGEAVTPDPASRARNLEGLVKLSPEIAASIDVASLRSRAAVRATTRDRAPIAGMLPDAEAWATGTRAALEGIFVLGGLGSRGLVLAPLLGEEIASAICGTPRMLSQPTLDAIDPARFLIRALKRRT